MTKKIVSSSHLSLRFYRHEGWTEEEIKSLMVKGTLHEHDDYWGQAVGSVFDLDKLLAVGRIFNYYDCELVGQEAIDYVKSMNWDH